MARLACIPPRSAPEQSAAPTETSKQGKEAEDKEQDQNI
jgi:hypothetical protein